MVKDDLFRIGVITEPHGIKGEVKVYPTTDEPGRMGKIKEMFLDDGKQLVPLHPTGARGQKSLVIMKFQEFNDRNDVEKLRKKELYITRDNAVKLKKDEYYITDLIGLKCIDEDEQEVGTIKDVMPTGANDVYVIERVNGEELLLPAIKQCVLEVNVEGGYVRVHVLEGL